MTFFQDGNELAYSSSGMDNTASKVTIGKRINTGSPGFVNGRIDAFSIWKKRELNKLEIKQLYNSGAGKFYPFN